MNRVVRVSHPVAAARATTERADANVTVARAGYLPQINATGSYVRILKTEFAQLIKELSAMAPGEAVPFGLKHTWSGGVQVNQYVWDGDRTPSAVAIAKSTLDLARLDERGQVAQSVLDVTQAYFNAVLADQLVVIGEGSLALAQQTYDYAKLGYEKGSGSEFDMVRSEVSRDTNRTALIRALADREIAYVRLRQLLGLPVDIPLVLTSKLAGDSSAVAKQAADVPPGPEFLPIAQARATLDNRRAQVRLARAQFMPQISAFMNYNVVDYPTRFWPDSNWLTNWTLGVNVAVPIFTGFRNLGQYRATQADRRAAEQLLAEAQEQTAVADIQSRTDVETSSATLVSSARSADLARRAYQIADLRYRQGVSTYLELSDARLALDRALVDEASAARDVQVARVRLALLPSLPLQTPTTATRATAISTTIGPVSGLSAPSTTTTTPTTTGSPVYPNGPASLSGTATFPAPPGSTR